MPTRRSRSTRSTPSANASRSSASSGKPAVAIAGGLPRREARVRDLGIVRLLFGSGVVLLRGLVEGIPAPALAVLVFARTDRDDHARPVARTDDHMVHPGRTVDEIPSLQRP